MLFLVFEAGAVGILLGGGIDVFGASGTALVDADGWREEDEVRRKNGIPEGVRRLLEDVLGYRGRADRGGASVPTEVLLDFDRVSCRAVA